MSDADTLFSAFSCMHTGTTNDVDAFESSKLKGMLESLPFPYHAVADGAYVCTESVMTLLTSGIDIPLKFNQKIKL